MRDLIAWFNFDEQTGIDHIDYSFAKRNKVAQTQSLIVDGVTSLSTIQISNPTILQGTNLGKSLSYSPGNTDFSVTCFMALTSFCSRHYWVSRGTLSTACSFLGKVEKKIANKTHVFTFSYIDNKTPKNISITVLDSELPLNKWFAISIYWENMRPGMKIFIPDGLGGVLTKTIESAIQITMAELRPDDKFVIGARGASEPFRGVFSTCFVTRSRVPDNDIISLFDETGKPRYFEYANNANMFQISEQLPLDITSTPLDCPVQSRVATSEMSLISSNQLKPNDVTAGLYWMRPTNIYSWNEDLAIEKGEWLWLWSSDHGGFEGNGIRGIRAGYSNSPIVPPTDYQTIIGDAVETPYITYWPGDNYPFRIYCHRIKNPRMTGIVSGSEAQQETIYYKSTSLNGPWIFGEIAVPVCLSDAIRENKYDNFHTGYTKTYSPIELNCPNYISFGSGASGTQLGAVMASSATGDVFNINQFGRDLDLYTYFLRCEEHNWYHNIIQFNNRIFGIGKARLSPSGIENFPIAYSVSITELTPWDGNMETSYKPIPGRNWHLLDSNGLPIGKSAFPSLGYIQDVQAMIHDGILYVYPLFGYIKELGQDEVKVFTYDMKVI